MMGLGILEVLRKIDLTIMLVSQALLKTLDPVSEYGMTEKIGEHCEKNICFDFFSFIIAICC